MSKIWLHSAGEGGALNLDAFLQRIRDGGGELGGIVCVDGFGRAGRVREYFPNAVTVGRVRAFDDTFDPTGDPMAQANSWYTTARAKWSLNPHIKVWQTLNEISPGLNADGWRRQADWYLRLMDLAEADGYRIGLWSTSTGTPPTAGPPDNFPAAYEQIARTTRRAAQGGHVLFVHEYGSASFFQKFLAYLRRIIPSVQADPPPPASLQASAPWHALRYRFLLDYLKSEGALCDIIIGECAPEAGYNYARAASYYLQDLAWYDAELLKDDAVKGAAVFTLGGGEWANSDYSAMFDRLAEYIITHPDPAPEPPPPPPPEVDYVVVVNLLPQMATKPQKAFVLDDVHESRETILQSADDARRLVAPGLPGSKVKIWDAGAWSPVADPQEIITFLGTPYSLHTLPVAEPDPPPDPPAYVDFGLHLFAGADTDAGFDYDLNVMVRSKAEGAKVTTNITPHNFDRLAQVVSSDNIILRLHMDFPAGIREPAAVWYERFGNPASPNHPLSWFRDKGGVYVEIGNEPNNPAAPQDGWGRMWNTAAEWYAFWREFVGYMIADYPDLMVGLPGLGPSPNVPAFMPFFQQAADGGLADWVSLHAYAEQDGATLLESPGGWLHPESGMYWKRFEPLGLRGMVTEIGNVNGQVSYETKAAQYVAYWKHLKALQGWKPERLFWYVSRSQIPDELARRQNIPLGMADIMGAR